MEFGVVPRMEQGVAVGVDTQREIIATYDVLYISFDVFTLALELH